MRLGSSCDSNIVSRQKVKGYQRRVSRSKIVNGTERDERAVSKGLFGRERSSTYHLVLPQSRGCHNCFGAAARGAFKAATSWNNSGDFDVENLGMVDSGEPHRDASPNPGRNDRHPCKVNTWTISD